MGLIKIIHHLKNRKNTRKKTFVYDFNGNVTKDLGNIIYIYRQQKYTFKLTIEFSFLWIKVEEVNKVIYMDGSECGRDRLRFGLDSISPEIGCL